MMTLASLVLFCDSSSSPWTRVIKNHCVQSCRSRKKYPHWQQCSSHSNIINRWGAAQLHNLTLSATRWVDNQLFDAASLAFILLSLRLVRFLVVWSAWFWGSEQVVNSNALSHVATPQSKAVECLVPGPVRKTLLAFPWVWVWGSHSRRPIIAVQTVTHYYTWLTRECVVVRKWTLVCSHWIIIALHILLLGEDKNGKTPMRKEDKDNAAYFWMKAMSVLILFCAIFPMAHFLYIKLNCAQICCHKFSTHS